MTDPPYHPEVYQPEADTWLLLSVAEKECQEGECVLEVGTGSGLIASRLTDRARVVATDLNPHACWSARAAGAEVVRTDLYSGLKGPFDLILFNPPYLPTSPEERIDDWLEYALDGGEDGCETIRQFLAGIDRVLAPGGRVLMLVSSLTGVPEVQALCASEGLLSFVVAEERAEDEVLYVLRIMRDLCMCRD